MQYNNLTNRELVLHVDNKPDATELEKELAKRMDELQTELDLVGYPELDSVNTH